MQRDGVEGKADLMKLAKPRIDIGLSTHSLEPMLTFWRDQAGLAFDHKLPIRRGQDQYRHDALGTVVKINHHAAALPASRPAGYRELIVARPGLEEARRLADPDGNLMRLAPPGEDGVTQIGVRIAVRDLAAHRRFYTEVLGLAEEPWAHGAAFRAGESLILAEPSADAPGDAQVAGKGWRYITLQVFKVDEDHARALAWPRRPRSGVAPDHPGPDRPHLDDPRSGR